MDSSEHHIVVLPAAEHDLRNIDPQTIPRIADAVDALVQHPFSAHHRKLKATEHQYRVRVGDYRIIYELDVTKRIVIIHHVRHRSTVYRRLG
jgi:mRNA interferase RelE/StbE